MSIKEENDRNYFIKKLDSIPVNEGNPDHNVEMKSELSNLSYLQVNSNSTKTNKEPRGKFDIL